MVSEPESGQAQKAPPSSSQERERPRPIDDLRRSVGELLDYIRLFISARTDAIKFSIKRRILTASLMAIAVLAGAGLIVTAVVLLCDGISDGLSVLLGRRWAGEMLTGFLLLGAVMAGAYFGLNLIVQKSYNKAIAKYEALQQKHREQFGRDVP